MATTCDRHTACRRKYCSNRVPGYCSMSSESVPALTAGGNRKAVSGVEPIQGDPEQAADRPQLGCDIPWHGVDVVRPEPGQERSDRGVHPRERMWPDVVALAHKRFVLLVVVDLEAALCDLHTVGRVEAREAGEGDLAGSSQEVDRRPAGGEVPLLGVEVHLGEVLERVVRARRVPG